MLLPVPGMAGSYEDFFDAVKQDDAAKVAALLRRGLDPNSIEPARGDTGLILALRDKSMQVVDVLLRDKNINLEARTFKGDTALMIAAFTNNEAAFNALLARGALVNQPGWTALHYAAAAGSNSMVKRLLDESAYIDAESPNKTTPIMMAARSGHILTVKLLLDEGADATLKNDQGKSAIDLAALYGHQDIVDGLKYRLRKAGKMP